MFRFVKIKAEISEENMIVHLQVVVIKKTVKFTMKDNSSQFILSVWWWIQVMRGAGCCQ